MRPLLAATVKDPQLLSYPMLGSPKLDGVRALVIDGEVMSRNMKRIPSKRVQALFRGLEGYDGELVCGRPTDKDCFRKTMSAVMSEDGTGVSYHVFDKWNDKRPFHQRLASLKGPETETLQVVPHLEIKTYPQLLRYERECLDQGYEGVMLRSPMGWYKQGRSTLAEGILMKLKQFEDSEAVITGYEPLMRNQNEQTRNELGYATRSSRAEGKVADALLGALVVDWQGQELRIGSGFTTEERIKIWSNQDFYRGKQVKFKYLLIGMKDLPRHPIFIGFREKGT